MRLLAILLLLWLIPISGAVSNTTLLEAFGEVFGVRDLIVDPDSPVMRKVEEQLTELGLTKMSLCDQSDVAVAGVLMRAALGNLQLGMRDSADWSVIAADPATGRLIRVRSFSAVRFAVIESLLLVSILALARALWMKTV